MSKVDPIERETQNKVIQLLTDELGYSYLGDRQDRPNNSNIEEDELKTYLRKQGYNNILISKAIQRLKTVANDNNDTLYEKNKKVYELLIAGINVQEDPSKQSETVKLFDWENFQNNDFGIAEEVTYKGNNEKRPDVVLYINGIALAVLELKRGSVDIGEGIRQNITNQQDRFIKDFFSTIQLVLAGNESEGLRYGTILTPEKFYLNWKEDLDDTSRLPLYKYLIKLCSKERLMELIRDFVLFDGGIKKLPRPHQFFGIKAAQPFIDRKESGIIWHTQGSGKSIVMVLLAKWILANYHNARICIITDRTELDKQIRDVFDNAGEKIYRAKSGGDLMEKFSTPSPRLMCSLVHKMGERGEKEFEEYMRDLKEQDINIYGDLFVFVDECHRTQSGKLHSFMKEKLKNATFIGFTGTPLLKGDNKTTQEVFGQFIHTYKFNEAVEDEIVKDLVYESRDVDQMITSQTKIDQFFEKKAKDAGLNDYQKSLLKKKWATMQNVLSSKDRLQKIVDDISTDFDLKPRLASQRGNAMLVAKSIYDACRYYELFQSSSLKGKVAVITSYNPNTRDIVTEDTGEATETQKESIYNTYDRILKDVNEQAGKSKSEVYEDWAKEKFIKEPANMKLLIVRDKLLTGFDAPSCSYLYIDKSMKDQGLFQAICRVNRLDTEDKDFGYIVDYMDLLDEVNGAISVYTSELDTENFTKEECQVLMKDRLKAAKKRLDDALEKVALICENVISPKGTEQYINYFCGNTEIESDLKEREGKRMKLYQAVVSLVRAYANIAGELAEAGYTKKQIEQINKEIEEYIKVREIVRSASGEKLDLKTFEADMQGLLDKYVNAKPAEVVQSFEDMTLLDIVVTYGIHDAINSLSSGIRSSNRAIAETLENNVRAKIIKDHLIDPKFYSEMSKVLDQLVKERKESALAYEAYLEKIRKLIDDIKRGTAEILPSSIKTPALRALYNNLGKNEQLALEVNEAILDSRRADWRGNLAAENEIKKAIYSIINRVDEVNSLFEIVKEQIDY
jgi:type I restriction enzyme R subunit